MLSGEDPERDYIVIASPITRELHSQLSDLLASRPLKQKATVVLSTFGGDPDGGYRIARCLRHHYKDGLRVAVPSWCKSAGTLIAIAANELGIGDRGELGPLDVQVFKGTELQERSSGLDITEALGVVGQHVRWGYHQMLGEARRMGLSTKLAAEMAAHIGAAMAAPLLNQVDPLRLGELQRATRIAFEYGGRLDGYSQNLKDDALKSLINDYPSHSFVIDRKEASNLFKRVSPLTPAENAFVQFAWAMLQYPSEHQQPRFINFPVLPNSHEGTSHESDIPAADADPGAAPSSDQSSGEPMDAGNPGAGGPRVRVRSGRNGAPSGSGVPADDSSEPGAE
jgi:Serine dehydrogenase proteinase